MTPDDITKQRPDDDGSWLRGLSDAAIPSSAPAEKPAQDWPEPAAWKPPVDRPRPERPPLVPKNVWIGLGVAVVALAVIVASIISVVALSRVAVPDVVGESLGEARTQLGRLGLEVQVTERRFSELPRNQVLEQSPVAGSQAQKGDLVQLVVSAGSEEFLMPDVINQQLPVARGTLESRGLVVVVETVVSTIPSDTVLSSTPSPGVTVRTGDTVRLQVSAATVSGGGLQPYNLQGVGVVVDAAPVTGNGTDPSLEVARRLRSLLEASGARVVMLRSSTSSATTDADRARAASQTTATVAVGFTVTTTGPTGRVVYEPAVGSVGALPAASQLATSVVAALNTAAPPASLATTTTDLVLQSSLAPWNRISLGSLSARADRNSFADPEWADAVARAIYEVIGKQFGTIPAQ